MRLLAHLASALTERHRRLDWWLPGSPTNARSVIDLNAASEKFSDGFKDAHPSLPWRALARTGSKFAHHYEDINRDLVWNMMTKEMPQMVATLQEVIEREE